MTPPKVAHLVETRRERSEPLRRSLEEAADYCLNTDLKAYVIVVVDSAEAVHVHWDETCNPLALVGGLEHAKHKLMDPLP